MKIFLNLLLYEAISPEPTNDKIFGIFFYITFYLFLIESFLLSSFLSRKLLYYLFGKVNSVCLRDRF